MKNIGVSVYYLSEALIALKDQYITHIQIPINILDEQWFDKEFLELLNKRKDVIINCRSIYLQGVLISEKNKWPRLKDINPDEYIKKLDYLVKEFNFNNKKELCISYVKSIEWINGVIVGNDDSNQLKQNIELFKIRKLTEDEFFLVRNTFKNVPKILTNPSLWNN